MSFSRIQHIFTADQTDKSAKEWTFDHEESSDEEQPDKDSDSIPDLKLRSTSGSERSMSQN